MPNNKQYAIVVESSNVKNSQSWGIDGLLIDEEMLYLEDKEADRVYQELKTRSTRRRKMEESENRLTNAMNVDMDEGSSVGNKIQTSKNAQVS